MNYSPSLVPTSRLTFVAGRLSEDVTDAVFANTVFSLAYSSVGKTGSFDAIVVEKPGGYFGLSIDPGLSFPDFSSEPSVDLELNADLSDGRTVSNTTTVAGADLVVSLTGSGANVGVGTLPSMAIAPIEINLAISPVAVGLRGVILRANDPDDPVDGATLSVDGLTVATSNSEGRFAIATLPLSKTVDVTVSNDGTDTLFTIQPDFQTPINLKTFALP